MAATTAEKRRISPDEVKIPFGRVLTCSARMTGGCNERLQNRAYQKIPMNSLMTTDLSSISTDAYPELSTVSDSSRDESLVGEIQPAVRTQAASSTRLALLALGAIFFTSIISLYLIYRSFPDLEPDELQYIKLPQDIDDAKNLGNVLSRYRDKYFYVVLGGMFVTYIFLQSFAIPGSIFLSILSGFLFNFPLALFLVCLCSAVGASLCFLLSYVGGRPVVSRYFPNQARQWADQVESHQGHLLYYIIFLRITPFLPNWFINITSPVIGVPLLPFFLGTFIGVAPPSFVAIQAGTTLHQLTSSRDALAWRSILMLVAFAVLSLVPVFFRKRLREKMM